MKSALQVNVCTDGRFLQFTALERRVLIIPPAVLHSGSTDPLVSRTVSRLGTAQKTSRAARVHSVKGLGLPGTPEPAVPLVCIT